MIRFANISRMIKSFLTEIISIGGTTQNRFISPKGLFSKPKDEKAIVINLSNGTNQDVVIALQKDIELEDGDVYVTDDKSYIHFKFKDGNIELKTNKLIFNTKEYEINTDKTVFNSKVFVLNADDTTFKTKTFTIDGSDTSFTDGSINHNGKPIDDTHQHTQTAGDHFGAGGVTTPPN